jgi:hypothetical protein
VTPELLVAGSIALDTLDGPFGQVTDELGGSALYFAMAASLIVPVKLVAPVGEAETALVTAVIGSRPIDTTYLQVIQAPTFRWRARQEDGRNVDLGSRDSIYESGTLRCRMDSTAGRLWARCAQTARLS